MFHVLDQRQRSLYERPPTRSGSAKLHDAGMALESPRHSMYSLL